MKVLENVWLVHWARAVGGEENPIDAFAGCYGFFYLSLDNAKAALTRCKSEFIADILSSVEDPEDLSDLEESLQIYGSEDEGYYEIDFVAEDGSPVEIYITVTGMTPEQID